MTNNFIIKSGEPEQKKRIWGAFKVALKAWGTTGKDFELVIREPEAERSPKALRGYWRLIGVITKHLNKTNLENWEDEDVSNQFKENIGFVRMIQMGDIYHRENRGNYKDILLEADNFFYLCSLEDYPNGNPYILCGTEREKVIKEKGKCIGSSYKILPKSLKKNKGCTLEDMEKLIGEVLRFGAGIPDCELRNEEQRGFDKYYGVK